MISRNFELRRGFAGILYWYWRFLFMNKLFYWSSARSFLWSIVIVKIYDCLFLYDYVSDNKPCNFPFFLVSEQHNYFTRSASAQQLHIPHSRSIFESFALPSLESTIGTISPFLFAINHRKSCSKRHIKNIILLNIDLCACVRVCVLMNNKTTKE